MTVSANIKDSMWELGVLRSMGCTNPKITRLLVYELMANTLSSITLGFCSGFLVSILAISLFYIIVELPFKLALPIG